MMIEQSTLSGALFIVSAPSGAGKTSLVRALIADHPDVGVAVSHTTRPIRPGETDGENYQFISPSQFEAKIKAGDFLEYALVFGNYYGTSRAEVNRIQAAGQHVVLEIDWQGAELIRADHQCQSIFILPPSLDVLHKRLTKRAQDKPETIARRTAEAVNEMSHYHEFNYLIVNDDFDTALSELTAIIEGNGELLQMAVQQARFEKLIISLLSGLSQSR